MIRRQLEYFLAVADRGSISAAARSLGVSQPTISEALGRMEAECGLTLVRSGRRGVTLSDAGRELLGPAAQVLRAYADLDRALRPISDVERGRLSLVCPRTLAPDPMAVAVGAFRRDFPDVAVTMTRQVADGIGAAVASGQADVGLGVNEVFDDGVERIHLGRQRIVALVASDIGNGDETDVSDLMRFGLITSPRGSVTRRLLAERVGERAVDDAVVAETSSAASMVPLVRAGLGVAFLPESIGIAARVDGVTLRRPRPSLDRDVWIFYRSSPSPASRAFIATTTRLRDDGKLGGLR